MEYERLSNKELLKMSKEELIDKLRNLEDRYDVLLGMYVSIAYPSKHAQWIMNYDKNADRLKVECSECGYKANYFWDDWKNAKYCPSCGAIIDEGK